MKLYRLAFALSVISFAILTAGCNSTENKPKESAPDKPAAAAPPPAPVPYTGEEAFNRMLALAVKWSPDAQPARVESVLTPETTGQDGKATIWRGYFASPARRAVKTIVCSGSRRPDAPPLGVSTEGDAAYNAESASLVFSQYLLKTDTSQAFTTAQQHGGDAIVKKDPQQPVTYVLLKDRKQNGPVWYVIYGASEKDRKGIGVINATTGAFVSAGK